MQTFEQTYSYTPSSGGSPVDIIIDVVRNTGVLISGDNSQSTHSIRVRFNSEDNINGGYTDDNIEASISANLQIAKDALDAVDEFARKLKDLGFTQLPELDPILNYSLTVTSSTSILRQWDPVANATGYSIETAFNPDFSPSQGITTHTSSPSTAYGLDPMTTYYMRIKATADGYGDSNWETANVTTT